MESVDKVVQTPEEQVQVFYVAQATLILQNFKDKVVYLGLDFHAEELALDQEIKVWTDSLIGAYQVNIGGCSLLGAPWEVTVNLTPELKEKVFVEVFQLQKAMLHACKDPDLVINYLDKGLISQPKNQ